MHLNRCLSPVEPLLIQSHFIMYTFKGMNENLDSIRMATLRTYMDVRGKRSQLKLDEADTR